MLKLVLACRANVNAKDSEGNLALHIALSKNQSPINIVRLLLGSHADINVCNGHGDTPLHLAHVRGGIKAVRSLLENHSQCSAQNRSGETPLHVAVSEDQSEIAKLLISHGSGIDIATAGGRIS